VYGTSLTYGGAWTVATKKWFSEAYPEKVKFLNSAGPGQNSDWGLANLKTKVLDHQPDLVFLDFSYNDARDKFRMPVAQGAANLRKMIEAIRSQTPDATIVFQTMNIGWDAPNGNGSLSHRPNLEQYNDNYRKVTQSSIN
jgi:acyl-CoA thioesterase-1